MTSNTNNGINVLQLLREGHSFASIAKMMHNKKHQDVNDTTSNIPSKEQLLNAFKNKLSFKHVSSVYQVNDKTIKEWLKTYKLPTTLKELKTHI